MIEITEKLSTWRDKNCNPLDAYQQMVEISKEIPVIMEQVVFAPAKLMEKGSIKMMTKDNYDVEKQTHDLPNRIRNHTSLLVLAIWTLGDHVAPE